MPFPDASSGQKLRWAYLLSILTFHALALLALVPWFFSWTGVITCFVGLYVFGTLGINLGFHRLLTHRSFRCPRWLEHGVALLGVCCLQEAPGRWVAIHRKHHQHSDVPADPHSPLVTAFWGHMGWLMIENRESDTFQILHRYARDIVTQPFYLGLERRRRWVWVYIAHALVFAIAGLLIGLAAAPDFAGAARFALSLVLWGVVVRTVLVWHITWSVNSLTHLWGYRTYQTGENSRNNWFVGLIANGEGWHNNHHADQQSAAHGHRWWEIDVTYITIQLLALVGLATHVKRHDRSHAQPALAGADQPGA